MKFLLLILCLMAPSIVFAQQDAFEGVLEYTTTENHNQKVLDLSQGMAYCGERNITVKVKSDRMHIIDQTMHIHTILLPEKNIAYLYSDVSNSGVKMDYNQFVELRYLAFDPQSKVAKLNMMENGVKNSGRKESFGGHECTVWEGAQIMVGGTNTIEVLSDESIKVNDNVRFLLNSLPFSGLPVKYKYIQETWSPQMHLYSEVTSELTAMTPKTMPNTEFSPESNIVFVPSDPIHASSFYARNIKVLKENGLCPPGADVAIAEPEPAIGNTPSSQQPKVFEGVLEYVAFENHSKKVINISKGTAYNGARHTTVFVKGKKVHIIDQSMHIHTILLPEEHTVYYYSDVICSGLKLNYEKYVGLYLSSFDPQAEAGRMNEMKNNVSKRGRKATFDGHDCEVYEGTQTVKFGTNTIEVWSDECISVPNAIRSVIWNLPFSGLPIKYTVSQQLKAPIIGKLSSYMAGELTNMTAKEMSDSDFMPSSDIKIKESDSPFKILSLIKDNTKQLKKQGIYPTDAEKETDVTYKIEDEWDF